MSYLRHSQTEVTKFTCQPCKKHDPHRENCTCEHPTAWMHDHGNTKPEIRHEPGKGL